MHAIDSIFYPGLFVGAVSEREVALLSLPTHCGDLNVANYVDSALVLGIPIF